MKKIGKYLFTIVISLSTALGFATEPTEGGTKGVDSGGGAITMPSVNQSANESEKKNKQGQIMSMLMAGMLFTQGYQHFTNCSSCSGSCTHECVMGAILVGMGGMSMMQASEHGNKASGARWTASMTDGIGGVDSQGSGLSREDLEKYPEIGAIPGTLKKMKPGVDPKYSYDPKTGKIKADGKEYNTSDFASGGAMNNAGIPQGAIDGALEYAASLEKKALDKTAARGLGGGTDSGDEMLGGGGGGVKVIEEEVEMASTHSAGAGLGYGEGGGSASMAGMSKDYNGDPIGVSGDSIFDMMTRRYNVKKQQDSFFTETDLLLSK